MKYKSLFRILLKVLGVYFLIDGMATLLGRSIYVAMSVVSASQVSVAVGDWMMANFNVLLTPIAETASGLYLFFGGKWIADKAIPGNRPYCHECGYDLTGAVESRCPECDTPFRMADVHPARTESDANDGAHP